MTYGGTLMGDIDAWELLERHAVDAAHGSSHQPAGERLKRALRIMITGTFGDDGQYLTDPQFHARVDLAVMFTINLTDPGWVDERWNDIHREEMIAMADKEFWGECACPVERARQVLSEAT